MTRAVFRSYRFLSWGLPVGRHKIFVVAVLAKRIKEHKRGTALFCASVRSNQFRGMPMGVLLRTRKLCLKATMRRWYESTCSFYVKERKRDLSKSPKVRVIDGQEQIDGIARRRERERERERERR